MVTFEQPVWFSLASARNFPGVCVAPGWLKVISDYIKIIQMSMPEVLGTIRPCDLPLRATITFEPFLDDFGICTHLYICWGTADQPPDIWTWIFILSSEGRY